MLDYVLSISALVVAITTARLSHIKYNREKIESERSRLEIEKAKEEVEYIKLKKQELLQNLKQNEQGG